ASQTLDGNKTAVSTNCQTQCFDKNATTSLDPFIPAVNSVMAHISVNSDCFHSAGSHGTVEATPSSGIDPRRALPHLAAVTSVPTETPHVRRWFRYFHFEKSV